MGSGCFKSGSEVKPLLAASSSTHPADEQIGGRLTPVVSAASKPHLFTEARVSDALKALASVPLEDGSAWLRNWLAKAQTRQHNGMILVLKGIITHCLDAQVASVETSIAESEEGGNEQVDTADFERLARACRQSVTLSKTQQKGMHTAAAVLRSAASTAQDGNPTPFIVTAFDRLVLLFRHAFLANIGTSASNLQQWQELAMELGLPAMEKHLALLSCTAKSALLSLLLIPDDVPPSAVILSRDHAIRDVGPQLPDKSACILLPYFESASGTKVVQGRRVEGGEGHGPRKELFVAVAADAVRRWITVSQAPRAGPAVTPVRLPCRGNRVDLADALAGEDSQDAHEAKRRQEVLRCLGDARTGDRIRIELSGGTEVEHTVVAVHGTEGLSVNTRFESKQLSVSRCTLERRAMPLFEFHRGSGEYWFAAGADDDASTTRGQDLMKRFRSFGKLLALALANRCRFSFTLPLLFFRLLLQPAGPPPELGDLKGFDDSLQSSLKKCLKMRQGQFKTLKEVENLPPDMTREAYVADKVRELLTPQAMIELRNGFWSLVCDDSLLGISPPDLRHMLCSADTGKGEINIRQIFRVIMEDEMADCPIFVDAFWSVVDGLSLAEKHLFLLFVTGVEAPPEAGTERLLIELPFTAFTKQEYLQLLSMLPQAHTCSNCLELPNYHDALKESGMIPEDQEPEVLEEELKRIIGEKLRLAIHETSGYELDAIDSDGGETPHISPKSSTTHLQELLETQSNSTTKEDSSVAPSIKSVSPARDITSPPVERPAKLDDHASWESGTAWMPEVGTRMAIPPQPPPNPGEAAAQKLGVDSFVEEGTPLERCVNAWGIREVDVSRTTTIT